MDHIKEFNKYYCSYNHSEDRKQVYYDNDKQLFIDKVWIIDRHTGKRIVNTINYEVTDIDTLYECFNTLKEAKEYIKNY